MIIDTIIFYNELDLLEIRLNILDKVVDKFVIVEATKTFVGNAKPLYFDENKDRFAKWKDKIVHYVVDELTQEEWDRAKKDPNVGNGEHWWVREFCQKEKMMEALSFCKHDDIVFISDLDEIWNPDIEIIRDGNTYRPIQKSYYYYLNNRSNQDIGGWVGTRYARFSTIKKHGINHFRTERFNPSIRIENGGWHFTFMGGAEKIREKIDNYGHQEYRAYSNRIDGAVTDNKDFLGRGLTMWIDESELPDYLITNKQKWIKLFR